MATSSRIDRRWVRGLAALLVLGAAAIPLSSAWSNGGGSRAGGTPGASGAGAFSWLTARPAPSGWTSARIASGGATLFYPPGWKPIAGDRGTVSAALRDASGSYLGYLNVTPRQGAERLTGWAGFRASRNAQEGDRSVRIIAAAEGLRLAGAQASCVSDDYLSRVGSHPYREVACILAGSRSSNVFVGASRVADWPRLGPLLERAASALIER
jgi:hypothetical protein